MSISKLDAFGNHSGDGDEARGIAQGCSKAIYGVWRQGRICLITLSAGSERVEEVLGPCGRRGSRDNCQQFAMPLLPFGQSPVQVTCHAMACHGLVNTASFNSVAAPANQDRSSTPGLVGSCGARYSLATRFIPSLRCSFL